jgi:pimeloyl-ACP methyl ester carboxylesterase
MTFTLPSLKSLAIALGAVALLSVGAGQASEPATSDFYIGTMPTQMYVERIAAAPVAGASETPVIFIHGGAHSGVCFTTTPDGRPGWANDFASAGRTVYVIDWPGVGRSGTWPQSNEIGPNQIVDSIVGLLEKTGPAILVGHSIGGTLAFKASERRPDLVKAVVGVSIGAVELPLPDAHAVPLDMPASPMPRQVIEAHFANAPDFPKEAMDAYLASLQPTSPRVINAINTITDELKLDRSKLEIWKKIPVLFLDSEDDKTALPERTAVTAELIGAQQVMLGRDWGLTGHGHMSIIERGSELISARILDWLKDK